MMTPWQLKVRAKASRDLSRVYDAAAPLTPRQLNWQHRRLMQCYRLRSLVALSLMVLMVLGVLAWRDVILFSAVPLAVKVGVLLLALVVLLGWVWYLSLVRWAPVVYGIYAERCEKAVFKTKKGHSAVNACPSKPKRVVT